MMGKGNRKSFVRTVLDIIAAIISVILVLLVIVTVIVHTPYLQKKITTYATEQLSAQLNTKVDVKEISITLPNRVIINNIYIEDTKQDTLAMAGHIKVLINPYKLLNRQIHINRVNVKNCHFNLVKSGQDSTYNFAFNNTDGNAADTNSKKNPSRAWGYHLDRLLLENIHLNQHDRVTGNEIKMRLGKLIGQIQSLKPQKQVFVVERLKLENTALNIITRTKQIKEPEPVNLDISLTKELDFSNVSLDIRDEVFHQTTKIDHANLYINTEQVDLINKTISVNKISLTHTNFSSISKPVDKKDSLFIAQYKTEKKAIRPPFNWNIKVDNIKLKNNDLYLKNRQSSNNQPGFNPDNLKLSGIKLKGEKINIEKNRFGGQLSNASFYEKNGFQLNNLGFGLSATPTNTSIQNFVLKTPSSLVEMNTTLSYPSFDQINAAKINGTFSYSTIGMKDLAYFVPSLKEQFDICRDTTTNINFKGKITASPGHLNFQSLNIGIDEHTGLSLTGTVENMDDLYKMKPDLRLDTLYTHRSALLRIINDTLIPQNIHIPDRIGMQGNIEEVSGIIKSNFNIKTSQGTLSLAGNMQTNPVDSTEQYKLRYATDYHLGQLIEQSELGKIKAKGTVSGKSHAFTGHEINTSLQVGLFEYLRYPYRNISITGAIKDKHYEGHVSVNDSSIKFNLDGTMDLQDTLPKGNVNLDLIAVNLQAINLTEQDIRGKTNLTSTFKGNNIDNINGDLDITNTLIIKNAKEYKVDSINFSARNTKNNFSLKGNAPFLDIAYRGSAKMNDLIYFPMVHLNKYIDLSDTSITNFELPNDFVFNARLYNSSLVSNILLPGIKINKTVRINAAYDKPNSKLIFQAAVPGLQYQNLFIDSLEIDIDSDPNSLSYDARFKQTRLDSFYIHKTQLNGVIGRQKIRNHFSSLDHKENVHYKISTDLLRQDNSVNLHILHDTLILNGKLWNIPEDNSIRFSNNIFIARNFSLTQQEHVLTVNTPMQEEQDKPTVKLVFKNFELATILALSGLHQSDFSSGVNGTVSLDQSTGIRNIDADITLRDVTIFETRMFKNIEIDAGRNRDNMLQTNIKMTDNREEINVSGTYNLAADNDSINGNIKIKLLQTNKLQPFIQDQISRLKGPVNGYINVSGTINDPEFTGKIKLKRLQATPTLLGSRFQIPRGIISFDDKQLNFQKIIILDKNRNKASLNGSVMLTDMTPLNLQFTANDFRLLNTKQGTYSNYYGDVLANINANATGTINAPVIDLELGILKNTNFFFVIPQDEASIEQEGVVVFMQKDTLQSKILQRGKEPQYTDTLLKEQQQQNITLTANLELDKEAVLHIVVDPATGEKLTVQGDANLSFAMNKGGGQSLTGRYEIDKGSYSLQLYEFINRDFSIQEGSYINWIGDVVNARVDINTYYKVETPPLALISSDMPSITAEEKQIYNTPLPFYVYLNITGSLMSPQISFNIKLAEEEQNAVVQSKLSQLRQNESQLNKQVFSLLLFKNFMQSGATSETPASYEINNTARTSISNLISNQLNQFASRYIEGVDINLDVSSYAQSQENKTGQTQVELDVSKQFLDERLSVSVGGNVAVQDEAMTKMQNINNFTGNVELEYTLTDDGRYRIKAYNKTDYENVLEGQIRKTGIALTYHTSFAQFRNLFTPPQKRSKEVDNE